jgi:hypothetical protein
MPKMTVRQMLETGALEAELERRVQNADDIYEKRDAQNALRIAKSWKASLSRTKALSARGMSKAVSLAVSIGDVEVHDLHSIAKLYAKEISSGELEREIQERLLRAIATNDLFSQRSLAMGLVKARAARRIIRQTELPGAKGQNTADGPAFGVTTIDMRALAATIGPPTGLPDNLGGNAKRQDEWDAIVRTILGPAYPVELDGATGDPVSVQIKAGTADDLSKRQRETLELARSIGAATDLPDHLGGLSKRGNELPPHLGGKK